MRDPYRIDRLPEATAIAATFIPGAVFVVHPRGCIPQVVSLHHPGGRMVLVASRDGAGLSLAPGDLRFGGTAQDALATLVRFVRDRTRRPLAWWARSFGAATLVALRESAYLDPAMVGCVLCGTGRATFDWWSDRKTGVQGPCCFYGRCRDDATGRDVMGRNKATTTRYG